MIILCVCVCVCVCGACRLFVNDHTTPQIPLRQTLLQNITHSHVINVRLWSVPSMKKRILIGLLRNG